MAKLDTAAWYTKHRPKDFSDYMGDEIKETVENRFTIPENRPQVIAIYGTRGCGKTTFTRIVSKYYLCENQIDGKPCEECEICQTINDILIGGEAGVECPGVVEVDATTANTKEQIQSILEDAILPPIFTKYKILIFDECHMITPAAQNSMLKTIEDIAPHLIVIFATTDWEKVLGTIKSRCQLKLEVRKKSVDEMANRLLYIAKQEGVTTSIEALKIIAKKADRIPRDCINLMEAIAKSYGNNVTIENVSKYTKDVAAEIYLEYFKAANSSLEDILIFNKKLKESDIPHREFISGVARFTLDCLYVRHGIQPEDYPAEFVAQINQMFKLYTSSEFDTLLQVIEHASNMIDGDNESKNELVITTTALRIGKIGLLASGLGGEAEQAEKENKQSIKEYKKQIDEEVTAQMEKINTYSPTKEKLIGILKGMTDVQGTENIIINTQNQKKVNEHEEGFFSADALSNLME